MYPNWEQGNKVMALIDCRECKKEVSSSVNKCPQCGIKTPDEKKYNSAKRSLWLLLIGFILVIFIVVFSDNGNAPKDKQVVGTASSDFIRQNPELGKLVFPYVEESTDWAQGKRQWVTTDRGRYLFYLKGNDVITVYLSDENANLGRREIWRKTESNDSSDAELKVEHHVKKDKQAVNWGIYQSTLKQDIEQMVEDENCKILKAFFDNAFDLQQSGKAGNPHVALVVYISAKRSDAGCHS